MADYIRQGGKSRGSFLVTDAQGDKEVCRIRFSLDEVAGNGRIQEVSLTEENCICSYRPVRSIPEADTWFEKVWGDYRKKYNSCDSSVI